MPCCIFSVAKLWRNTCPAAESCFARFAPAHGLPSDVALAALTHTPARIFGMPNRGQIAPGQVADLVLWSGDPLEVTSAADQVWIAGLPMEMRSRQTELRDRYLRK